MKYHIDGTFEIIIHVPIKRIVEAESEEEALDIVQKNIHITEGYYQGGTWLVHGPDVSIMDDDSPIEEEGTEIEH